MKRKIFSKSLGISSLVILIITLLTVSVFAYYKLSLSNNYNVIKASYHSVDLTLYEKITQEEYDAILDTTSKKTLSDDVYLRKIAKESDTNAFDFLIYPNTKNLYLEVNTSTKTNIDFKVKVLEKDFSDNSLVAEILSETTFSDEDSLTMLVYTANDPETKIEVIGYGIYNMDDIVFDNYIVKGEQVAPSAPTLLSSNVVSNVKEITLNAITTIGHGGVQYAVNTSSSSDNLSWQESNVFSDLDKDTIYYFYARYAGDEYYYPSDASSALTLSNKLSQTAPEAPTYASATSNSLTVNAITTTGHGDVEYAVSTSTTAPTEDKDWQTSTTLTSLTEGTTYYFFARYAGDSDYDASPASSGANLGLGYSLTLYPLTDITYTGDTGHNKKLHINFVNGDNDDVLFKPLDSQQAHVEIHSNSTTQEEIVITSAYTYTNVISLQRLAGDYITYYIGNDSENSYTWDFGNGNLTLSNDISITKAGVSNCIDENSLITMADGSLKAMKDIEVGDEVLSIDYDTMTLVARKVIYTGKDDAAYDTWTVASYYKHTFSDGTVIKRAMRHRFYCLEEESYKHMDYWENGLHAYKINGTNPTLVSTEIIQEELHYGRITLEGSNNYFANGLSTGDSECCPNKVVLNTKLEKSVN